MTQVLPADSARTTDKVGSGARATVASAMGFALDFYDLYIVVFVAPVIANLFFPAQNTALSLAGAFGALAATLLMRPVGAMVMGSLADRRGRRSAMVVALFGVGGVTALMGVLPTMHQAGVLAPILLLALRLIQGIFVGGVFASTLTMAIETVPPRWRGLVSGVVGGGGTAAGSVLAALSFFAATQLFPGSEFAEWGWRAMFLVGGLPVLLSLLALRYVDESPLWKQNDKKQSRPLKALIANSYGGALVRNILIVFGIGSHFLLTLGFLPAYLQVVNGLDASVVSPLLVWINLTTLVCAPLTGQLSELFGRRRVLLAISAVNAVALPILYWQLAGLRDNSLGLIITITILVSCLTVAAFGPLPIFLNEQFHTAVRASGIALSVNVGFAVAGLIPAAVNAWSGNVGRLPMFAIGALILASVVTLISLGPFVEPRHGPDKDLLSAS